MKSQQPSPQNNQPSPSEAPSVSTDRFEQAASAAPDSIGPDDQQAQPSQPAPAASANDWPVEVVRGFFLFPTNYLAGRLGEYWTLSDEEVAVLVSTWKPVLDLYVPLSMLGVVGMALTVSATVFMPRVAEWQLQQQKSRARRAKPVGENVTPSTATEPFAAS